MKTINKFLLEKLIIGNNLISDNTSSYKDVNIKFYKYDWNDEIIDKNTVWKELKFPLSKYVIYKDKYRHDLVHLAKFLDMIYNIYLFEDDFEDFNPDKDILFYSNDPKEIITWYLKKILNVNLPDKYNNNVDKWYEAEHTTPKAKRICDEFYILGEFYNNPEMLDDMCDDNIDDLVSSSSDDVSDIVVDGFEKKI